MRQWAPTAALISLVVGLIGWPESAKANSARDIGAVLQPSVLALYLGSDRGQRSINLLRWFEHTAAANGWVVQVVVEAKSLQQLIQTTQSPLDVVALTNADLDALSLSQKDQLAGYVRSGGGLMVLTDQRLLPKGSRRVQVGAGRRLVLPIDAAVMTTTENTKHFDRALRRLTEQIRWVRTRRH